jgi:pyruvate dehydrogenase E1 component beta subunit
MTDLSFAEAIGAALREEMSRDPAVFVQGEDVGPYGGGYFPAMKGLWEQFGGERVRDFPISESAIVGTAVGAALTGLRPVVDIMFADFTFVCLDQIVNQMALMRYMSGGAARVPMVVRGVHGGYSHQASQHSHSPEAIFCQFPGLLVVAPSSSRTAKGLLKAAIRADDPVVFLEHKVLYTLAAEAVPDGPDFVLPLGMAEIARPGRDVTLVASGYQTRQALQAADRLAGRGVSAEVVDLLTLAPLDKPTLLDSISKTRRLVAVQEAPPMCGIAAEIVALVVESGVSLRSAPRRVTARQAPVPFSPALEPVVLPSVEDIVNAAAKALEA